ncbi:hypothetical protein DPMN_032375 [Dreissena polymorpha]|uniref:Uncharacterized protein n=1 Tax=Dreissena polymorpha TaxID=45954 RepID=A0A9D4M2R5_DREPO|nr:hypothetical protein DPMN_032375 [Dreissena polymorpha]
MGNVVPEVPENDNKLVCIRFNEEAYSEGIHASSQQYVARLTTSSPLVKSSGADTEHVKRIAVSYEQTFPKKAEFDRRENKSKADKNTEEIVESCVHRVHRNARRHLGLTKVFSVRRRFDLRDPPPSYHDYETCYGAWKIDESSGISVRDKRKKTINYPFLATAELSTTNFVMRMCRDGPERLRYRCKFKP